MTHHFLTTVDLDRDHPRKGTASYKWDQLTTLFGSEEVLPLWVADMDFPCAPEIIAAIVRRAQEGLYGYTIRTPEWEQAMTSWFAQRHQWQIAEETIVTSPSVVTSLAIAIELLSQPGDSVLLQNPVYHPFYDVIRLNNRVLVDHPLYLRTNPLRYEMDVERLRAQLAGGVKMILLCNPHNPGGRVWTENELRTVAMLCAEYDVFVVSDEIHGDLVFSPHRFQPFLPIATEVGCRAISLVSATKTFNIPGIPSSFAIIPDASLRSAFTLRLKALSLHMQSFFAHTAVIAAYEYGAPWLDTVLAYIGQNITEAVAYVHHHAPAIRCMVPEGTYLLWLDVRALGLSPSALRHIMYEKARVAFNEGSMFGSQGNGFLRVNCACPRERLHEALRRFVAVLHEASSD